MPTERPMEVKKDGLRQTQDGIWKLTLTVHPEDMPISLMTASMGTRYGMALVEIGDDEQPVQQPEKPKGGRRAREAGIACGDQRFQAWSMKDEGHDIACTEVNSIHWIYEQCSVDSRAELDHNEAAGQKWDVLYACYLEETGQLPEKRG